MLSTEIFCKFVLCYDHLESGGDKVLQLLVLGLAHVGVEGKALDRSATSDSGGHHILHL